MGSAAIVAGAGILLALTAVVACCAHEAPEGYEDEEGFWRAQEPAVGGGARARREPRRGAAPPAPEGTAGESRGLGSRLRRRLAMRRVARRR